MAFQNAINIYNAAGVIGEFAFDGPQRVENYYLNSTGVAQTFGKVFTRTSGGNPNNLTGAPAAGVAQVGGTGYFAGILISPKEHVTYGTTTSIFAPNNALPDGTIGQLAFMGEVWVDLQNTALVGDRVYYAPATGLISAITRFSGTGSITGTTLTITATAGGALTVGSEVSGPNIAPNTVITALGTGTGGNGTYTVNQTQTAASSNVFAAGTVPAGSIVVPGASISRFDVTAAGLACLKLTN